MGPAAAVTSTQEGRISHVLSFPSGWCNTDKRWLILSSRNKRTESVRTIGEVSLEFVPQTFKRYFQNFLLKANQQFVEILPTTYIFQSRSIYEIAGKVE